MSITTIKITPRDPIIARDGRPFGPIAGSRMHSLDWPLPSVTAGSFRSALVKSNPQFDFTKKTPLEVMRSEITGVLPCTTGQQDGLPEQLYVPAPSDSLWNEKNQQILRTTPIPLGGDSGVNWPHQAQGLHPVMLTTEQAPSDFKPKTPPAWWPMTKMCQWLTGTEQQYDPAFFDTTFLDLPYRQERDHVCIDPQTGTAEEGKIFTTVGLHAAGLPRFSPSNDSLPHNPYADITLAARVMIAEKALEHARQLDGWYPMGGERRLVHWKHSEEENDTQHWKCPESVKTKLTNAPQVRMILATPAIFQHGWRPAWLDPQTLQGKPFGDGPTLKLVGLAIPRWHAVSGWAYAPHEEDPESGRRVVPKDQPGPKAIRRMVPAGGTYFFQTVDGDTQVLANNGWFRPISDQPFDRRDGFGLALWGTW